MRTKTKKNPRTFRVGIVTPHIFMHEEILPHVIFAPAKLSLDLSGGLQKEGVKVTLFTPGPIKTSAKNITADLSLFQRELSLRSDTYIELLKKHSFTFVTLARQVQGELIAKAYEMANKGHLDVVHIYMNEEDIALPFASLCTKPVVFTHHDPFNFLVKYKNVFPKYKRLNWISMSYAQRQGMPIDTNWVGNVYHGLSEPLLRPIESPSNDYVAYLGRIIEPKGVHLAIKAIRKYNSLVKNPLKLKIAGKHYAGHKKDTYWQKRIQPYVDNKFVEYIGFMESPKAKRDFLGNARALMVPSLFEEPFGMVSVEALACGTPIIALDSGALPEVIRDKVTGLIVPKVFTNQVLDEQATAANLAQAIQGIDSISRAACRKDYEDRFTSERMCREHLEIYKSLIKSPNQS